VRFGRCAIVRFRFATVAAFLMLRRAAVRCFAVAMVFSFDWIFLPELHRSGSWWQSLRLLAPSNCPSVRRRTSLSLRRKVGQL